MIYRAESFITVRVVNHSQLDVILFLVHDGVRDRLGAVTAATTLAFSVNTRTLGQAGEYWLLADPIGSKRTARTDLLRASDAGTVTWTLESNLDRGSVILSE